MNDFLLDELLTEDACLINPYYDTENLRSSTIPILGESQIDIVEKNLPFYDHVAFAFLVYDNPSVALQKINGLVELHESGNDWQKHIISPWITLQPDGPSSSAVLVEVLSVLQNWKLLQYLSVDTTTLQIRRLNTFRLTLFSLIDRLSEEKARQLVEKMDGKSLGTSEFIEARFLAWLESNRITEDNFRELTNIIAETPELHTSVEGKLQIARHSSDLAQLTSTIPQNPGSIVMGSLPSFNTRDDFPAAYPVNPTTAGLCIIVNQRDFSASRRQHLEEILHDRHGTDEDCHKLMTTFKMFGYNIEVLENLTAAELLEKISSMSCYDFTNWDSLVICILSHGVEGAICCVDGKKVCMKELKERLSARSCPTLCNKPKLFFIQACQGSRGQEPVEVLYAEDVVSDSPAKSAPPISDFFEAWATVPGYASYRSRTQGSVFIKALCSMLQDRGHLCNLDDIMKLVNTCVFDSDNEVKGNHQKEVYKQMSDYRSCLRKNMKFARHKDMFCEAIVDRMEDTFLSHFLHVVASNYDKCLGDVQKDFEHILMKWRKANGYYTA